MTHYPMRNERRPPRWQRCFEWSAEVFDEPGLMLSVGGFLLVVTGLVAAIAAANGDQVEGVVVDTWTEEHCSDNDPEPFPPQPPPAPPPMPMPDGNPFVYELGAAISDGIELALECETKLHAKVEYQTPEGEPADGELAFEDLDAVAVGDHVHVYPNWTGAYGSRFDAFLGAFATVFLFGGALLLAVVGLLWVIGRALDAWAWRWRRRNLY